MPSRDEVAAVIRGHLADLKVEGVKSIRPGWEFRDGWLTGRRAIVVTTDPGASPAVPDEIGGIVVDVRHVSVRKRKALAAEFDAALAGVLNPADGVPPVFLDEITTDGAPVAALAPAGHDPSAAAAHPHKPKLAYEPPPNTPLAEVAGNITIQVCASPDAGWPVLKAFLAATQSTLTIGLYDCTSAHVLDWLTSTLADKTVELCLDHPAKNPTADQTDEETVEALSSALGAGFTHAWALDNLDPKAAAYIFPTAYHIKVAVRDGSAVWLSSGNWNNSNQPDIDPINVAGDRAEAKSHDRDWHAVIDNTELARIFEAYVKHDRAVAAAHQATTPDASSEALLETIAEVIPTETVTTPEFIEFYAPKTVNEQLRIVPLLTPDSGSYAPHVKDLINSATQRLYIQTQYIHVPQKGGAEAFTDILDAVVARKKAGVDVRIIMSQWETVGYLEQLMDAGVDVVNDAKIQNNLHNKGIVVDTQRVLISSQNWSSQGVLQNRDAGVIIESATLAAYLEEIFLHDWEHLARRHARGD